MLTVWVGDIVGNFTMCKLDYFAISYFALYFLANASIRC